MHSIKFSIVIVNYNGGKYLDEAIKSIITQSSDGFEFELIIVDGASTDNSVEIIKKHSDKIAWWVSEEDNGQSDAFNKGFSKAKGQYVFWINSDDWLLPNSLIKANKVILENPGCSWFAANTIFSDVNGIILKCSQGLSWSDYVFSRSPINVNGPTSIFTKDLLDQAGGFDQSLHYTMDTDLWMRFRIMGHRFVRIPDYMWAFRIHNESKTSHAYTQEADPKFAAEQKKILVKNGYKYSAFGFMVQKVFKIVNGTYLRSSLDTLRFKGTNVKDIYE